MRDEKRIPVLLEKLEKVWSKPANVDLRLGQLLEILAIRVRNFNDAFYLEDDELIKLLDEELSK
jgi:hypothetical protein